MIVTSFFDYLSYCYSQVYMFVNYCIIMVNQIQNAIDNVLEDLNGFSSIETKKILDEVLIIKGLRG